MPMIIFAVMSNVQGAITCFSVLVMPLINHRRTKSEDYEYCTMHFKPVVQFILLSTKECRKEPYDQRRTWICSQEKLERNAKMALALSDAK